MHNYWTIIFVLDGIHPYRTRTVYMHNCLMHTSIHDNTTTNISRSLMHILHYSKPKFQLRIKLMILRMASFPRSSDLNPHPVISKATNDDTRSGSTLAQQLVGSPLSVAKCGHYPRHVARWVSITPRIPDGNSFSAKGWGECLLVPLFFGFVVIRSLLFAKNCV